MTTKKRAKRASRRLEAKGEIKEKQGKKGEK